MSRKSPLLASLVRRLGRVAPRKPTGTDKPAKLFRDEPADWKDAVYSPKGFRRRK